MTSPRPAPRGEGPGEGYGKAWPSLPKPLLYKQVEEREKTKSPNKGDALHEHGDAQPGTNSWGEASSIGPLPGLVIAGRLHGERTQAGPCHHQRPRPGNA